MSERNIPGISESHLRAFTSTLALVDGALCEFARWASGHSAKGVMYEEINDLSPKKQKELLGGIRAVRKYIRGLRDKLGLKPEQAAVSHKIWVQCSTFWEALVELESTHMKRYGALPPKLADELDTMVTRINKRFQGLSIRVRAGESPSKAKEEDK